MLYRRFPKISSLEISALGLGCMRLPTIGGDASTIDEAAATAMLADAVSAGVNYVDTAWPYHGQKSEPWLGRAVEDLGVRDRVHLATKAPSWLVREAGDWETFLSEQLSRLRTDRVDFYLVHALNRARWKNALQTGGLEFLAKAKADGRIGHVGFSFHDAFDSFKEIVDGWDGWEFCQVQYNYLDEDYQAGGAGLRYAAGRDLGVIVMEPLRGGALARVPEGIRTIFAKYPTPRMPAEWALRHALDRQEVVTVLSGMGRSEELWENAGVASSARPNAVTKAERALLDEARDWFLSRTAVPCTACGYCKPCPSGVDIPAAFGLWNEATMFGALEASRRQYESGLKASGSGAEACADCGACVPKCPQGIDIPARLAEALAALS
ncbi:MAG: aldo/keto reductase [Spirochaetes bacterium]|nr:aldo/keto reductase [Spirochaetota bacterium]MBU1081471.1 aldo/keto reductase [Spirochaetota bacterium]